ncbi:hypothetical protein CDD81_974 [Ophiocordyceps australis]|uniref:DNA2/NAM7 helicase helicase domain-containing protein n=1 Tax=Ophiocordyceps australis TaxID=1399860 RepID=A0A2C5XFT1_9HYPO|nr:hypothetical protein CDD81_974 [Ophiocordyceps australis]
MCKIDAINARHELDASLQDLRKPVTYKDILSMLEFSGEDEFYWESFQVPEQEAGFQVAARNNAPLTPSLVYQMWIQGKRRSPIDCNSCVWALPMETRFQLHDKWSKKVDKEKMAHYAELAEKHAQLSKQINNFYEDTNRNVLRSKRIIGCTTTAASMYQSIIASASPDIVIVEEAGEILESHLFAALSQSIVIH